MAASASKGAGQLLADSTPKGMRASEPIRSASALATPSVGDGGGASLPATRVTGDDPLVDPVSEQGQRARGLYFSGPVYKRLGAKGIIRKLRAAKMDAAVIDMKDGEGRVNYDTQIPALQPQKRRFVSDMRAFVAELKAAGIYVIGRVVCFSDPYLPRNEPDRAVMDNRPRKAGVVWANWGGRNTWLDPYNPKNHQLIVDMAKEVEALGVDEIQLDYVRFPVDEATVFAMFPAQVDKPRREVLIGMLKQIDEAIHIPLGCDVFGLTALRRGDPAGLGQSLEDWVPYVEVFSPMLYINGMQSLIKRGGTARAQKLVHAATSTLRERVGPTPVIRPFLQGFSTGADYYNPEFIAEQVRGVRQADGDGFLFWHPGSNYKMVQMGMVGPGAGMNPLPLADRAEKRRALWSEALAARETRLRASEPQAAGAPASVSSATLPAPAQPVRRKLARVPPRQPVRVPPGAMLAEPAVRVPPGAMPEATVTAEPGAEVPAVSAPRAPAAAPSSGGPALPAAVLPTAAQSGAITGPVPAAPAVPSASARAAPPPPATPSPAVPAAPPAAPAAQPVEQPPSAPASPPPAAAPPPPAPSAAQPPVAPAPIAPPSAPAAAAPVQPAPAVPAPASSVPNK